MPEAYNMSSLRRIGCFTTVLHTTVAFTWMETTRECLYMKRGIFCFPLFSIAESLTLYLESNDFCSPGNRCISSRRFGG